VLPTLTTRGAGGHVLGAASQHHRAARDPAEERIGAGVPADDAADLLDAAGADDGADGDAADHRRAAIGVVFAAPPENTASMPRLATTSHFRPAARTRYTASSRRSVEHGGRREAIVSRGMSMDAPTTKPP
jgi:hypothetical protein